MADTKYRIFEYADGTYKIGDNTSDTPYGYGFNSYSRALEMINRFKKLREERKNSKPLKEYWV